MYCDCEIQAQPIVVTHHQIVDPDGTPNSHVANPTQTPYNPYYHPNQDSPAQMPPVYAVDHGSQSPPPPYQAEPPPGYDYGHALPRPPPSVPGEAPPLPEKK